MSQLNIKHIALEWYQPLYRFALSLSKNPDDAMDLTQSAFYKLASKGGQIRDHARIKSWLFSVVHRAYLDQYRHNTKFPKDTIDSIPEPMQAGESAPGTSLDAEVVVHALHTLDERFRTPLALYYFNNFSYRDIAETLDIPIGTVMSRLRRAKDQLRGVLESPNQRDTSDTVIHFKKEASHG